MKRILMASALALGLLVCSQSRAQAQHGCGIGIGIGFGIGFSSWGGCNQPYCPQPYCPPYGMPSPFGFPGHGFGGGCNNPLMGAGPMGGAFILPGHVLPPPDAKIESKEKDKDIKEPKGKNEEE